MIRTDHGEGIVQFQLKKSIPPLPLSASGGNFPATLEKGEIATARCLCVNMLVSHHLIENAQVLSQVVPNEIGHSAAECLRFLVDLYNTVDKSKPVSPDKPSILVFLELLEGENTEDKMDEKDDMDDAEEGDFPEDRPVAGYRILAYINDDSWLADKHLKALFDKNRTSKEPGLVSSLDAYIRLATCKNGGSAVPLVDSIKGLSFDSAVNPVNPLLVFSIDKAMYPTPGVHPEQCDKMNYLRLRADNTVENIIAFPDKTIRLTDTESLYEILTRLQLPTPMSLLSMNDIKHSAFGAWNQLFNYTDLKPPLLPCEELVCPSEESFRVTFGSKNITSSGVTAEMIERVCAKEREEIERTHRANKNDKSIPPKRCQKMFQVAMDKFYRKQLDEFRSIWNRHASVSTFLQAAIIHFEDYLKENNNRMYNPVSKFSLDLSTWQEIVINYLNMVEMIYAGATCQINLFRAQIAAYNALDNERKNKFHYLAYGEAAVSKSYVLDLLDSLSIPNMIDQFTYKTLKSDAVGGNFDESIDMFHETPYAMMGYNSAGKANMPTEQEQMAKEVMTSGYVRLKEIIIDEQRNRCLRKITASKNCVYIMATNAKDIKEEFESRVFKDRYRFTQREGRTIPELLCAPRNPNKKLLSKEIQKFYRWMHSMHALLNQLIKCGILLEAKTTFMQAMLPKIMEEAKKVGITKSSERPRAIARLLAAGRVAVKWRAIHILFCSELSPFRGKELEDGTFEGVPFRMKHMLACQGLMIDSDPRILTLLLGILRSDFEEENDYTMIEGVKRSDLTDILPEEEKKEESSFDVQEGKEEKKEEKKQQQQPKKDRRKLVTKDDKYYCVENIFPPNINDYAKRDLLAGRWRMNMNPMPQRDEIVKWISQQCGRPIQIDTKTTLMAMEFTEKGYKILIKICDDNCQDKFEKVVKRVMEHSQTVPGLHLFGTDIENYEPCDLKPLRIERLSDQKLELNNLDFYPEKRREMLRAHFRHSPSLSSAYTSSFSTNRTKSELKQPLEETLDQEHYEAIGWTPERCKYYNVYPERIFNIKLLEECKRQHQAYKQRVIEATMECNSISEEELIKKCGLKPINLTNYDPKSLRDARVGPVAIPAPGGANLSKNPGSSAVGTGVSADPVGPSFAGPFTDFFQSFPVISTSHTTNHNKQQQRQHQSNPGMVF